MPLGNPYPRQDGKNAMGLTLPPRKSSFNEQVWSKPMPFQLPKVGPFTAPQAPQAPMAGDVEEVSQYAAEGSMPSQQQQQMSDWQSQLATQPPLPGDPRFMEYSRAKTKAKNPWLPKI